MKRETRPRAMLREAILQHTRYMLRFSALNWDTPPQDLGHVYGDLEQTLGIKLEDVMAKLAVNSLQGLSLGIIVDAFLDLVE